MKSDLGLVFDWETDVAQLPVERLRRVAVLGILIGLPAAIIGAGVSWYLVAWANSANKATLAPGALGGLLLANGLYRLLCGFVPIIARVRALRMAVMLVLICAIVAAALYVLFMLES